MRTLILGTCYIAVGSEGAQNYGKNMVLLWAKLAAHLNPVIDILLIDSASPEFAQFKPGCVRHELVTKHPHFCSSDELGGDLLDVGFAPHGVPSRNIWRFPDNVGHLNTTGVDGFGRAFCKGIELAIKEGYDYVAYMDCDIIFTRPVAPIIEKMTRSGVKAACPMDTQYNFLENGLMFLDVAYLRGSNFIEKYNWKYRSRTNDPNDIPEMVFERLLEDVIFTLPLRGLRDDRNLLTVNNLEGFSPYGLDYLTHVKDFAVYERFLEMKGITL